MTTTEPKRYSFQHRYFSADRRDDAEQIAERAITDTAIAGDPFMLQKQYAQRSQREIDLLDANLQLASPICKQMSKQGPLRSAYGWHVVRVTRLPSRMLTFDEVQDRVLADWQQTQCKLANADYYRSLIDRYNVWMPEPTEPAP